jgi:hypothetical protein
MARVFLCWGKILIQEIANFGILMQVIAIFYLVFSMKLFFVSLNILKKMMDKTKNKFAICYNWHVLLVQQMYT